MKVKNWAVFISGTGSNLGALLDMRDHIHIKLVVSSSAKAYGIAKAKRAGIPVYVAPSPIDWRILQVELERFGVDRVFLAGFMKIVPKTFVDQWRGRMVNVHPSLLPAYPGLHSIEKAFKDQAHMGVTIHEVVPEVDSGPMIFQKHVTRAQGLAESEFLVHLAEYRLVREVARRWKTSMM